MIVSNYGGYVRFGNYGGGFGTFTEADITSDVDRCRGPQPSVLSLAYPKWLADGIACREKVKKAFFDVGRGPFIYGDGSRQDTYGGPVVQAQGGAPTQTTTPGGPTTQAVIDVIKQIPGLNPAQIPGGSLPGGPAPVQELPWYRKIFQGNTWIYVGGAVILGGGLLLAGSPKGARRPATAGLGGYGRRKKSRKARR